MDYSILTVYDKVAKSYIDLTIAQNPQMFIRNNLKFLLQHYPLKDIELLEIGKFNTETGKGIFFTELRRENMVVSWDSYKYPENLAENLAPLGADVQKTIESFEKKVKEDSKGVKENG